MKLSASSTLSMLWAHCDNERYAQGHYRCEMGCELDFNDPGHRLDHYAKPNRFSGQLSSTQCPEPECMWTPNLDKSEAYRRGEILIQYTETHGPQGYHEDSYFKDGSCQCVSSTTWSCTSTVLVNQQLTESFNPNIPALIGTLSSIDSQLVATLLSIPSDRTRA